MDEARTRGRVACRRLAVSFRQILGCVHTGTTSIIPSPSSRLRVSPPLSAGSDRLSLKWFVFDLTTTATPSSGADEGTPFPSESTRAASGHHSLRSGRKEGKTCGGIACPPRVYAFAKRSVGLAMIVGVLSAVGAAHRGLFNGCV